MGKSVVPLMRRGRMPEHFARVSVGRRSFAIFRCVLLSLTGARRLARVECPGDRGWLRCSLGESQALAEVVSSEFQGFG